MKKSVSELLLEMFGILFVALLFEPYVLKWTWEGFLTSYVGLKEITYIQSLCIIVLLNIAQNRNAISKKET